MDKDLKKGIKIGLGFFVTIFLLSLFLFGIVFAVGFHSASDILPGIFQGDYIFNGSINATDLIYFQDGSSLASAPGEEYGYEFIDKKIANNNLSVSFVSLENDYEAYLLVIQGLIPQTDATDLYFRVSTNNGSSWDSGSNYYFIQTYMEGGASFTTSDSGLLL